MLERCSIQQGMGVRGARGELLGRVVGGKDTHLLIRRRRWASPAQAVDYRAIARLSGGSVWLRGGRELLLPPELASGKGPLMTVLPLDPRAESVAAALGL
jgi:hypothetical protein